MTRIHGYTENDAKQNSQPDSQCYSAKNLSKRSSLSSVENRTNITLSDRKRNDDNIMFRHVAEENNPFKKKRNNSSTSIINPSSSLDKHNESDACDETHRCSSIESEEDEEPPPSKRLKKRLHHTHSLTSSRLKMEWMMVRTCGVGLNNKDAAKKCRNICYINSIIQCLANTAPFVQWLLNNDLHGKCQLTAIDDFCSVCILRSIINEIHRHMQNQCDLFSGLAQASAVSLARQITKLSSNFIPGRQEDPHEFLVVLFDHLMQCLASVNSPSFAKYLSNPIHFIFGINIKSSIKCTMCLNKTSKENYKSIWSIPIVSYSTVEQALTGFCSTQKLTGADVIDCRKCQTKVSALQSSQLINISPVIFIHLKRFIYDRKRETVRKLKQFISYPELLDLHPFIDKNVLLLNQENHQFTEFIYRLYAVVVHLGETANNGHIFSYVRAPDNCWYQANDESITLINLDTVLADNNSYILCYAKLPEEELLLSETETNKSCRQSPHFQYSSTPIRPDKRTFKTIDDCTPIQTNSTSSISSFDDDLSEQTSRTRGPILNEYSPSIDESISVDDSPIPQDLFSLKNQLFPQRTLEQIEMQTESRIEIISNNNHNNKHSSGLDSSGITSSSLSSQSMEIPLSRKKRVSSRNTSSKSSPEPTGFQNCSNSSTGTQLNATAEEEQEEGDFYIQMPSLYQFKLRAVDLVKLNAIRTKKNNKKRARLYKQMGLPLEVDNPPKKKKIFLTKQTNSRNRLIDKVAETSGTSNDSIQNDDEESNVDVEYLYILLPYIKRFNKYCGLCVRNCTFGMRTDGHYKLVRCTLRCAGCPICSFSCSVLVSNNGSSQIIVTNKTVRHPRGTKICRPIRKPMRTLIKEKFAQGATVYRMYQEGLQKRTSEEHEANNYDAVGKSRNILRKIKSENTTESLLAADVDEGLYKLHQQFQNEINIDGKIRGAIQKISKYPCQIIVYSETSIRLFDSLLRDGP